MFFKATLYVLLNNSSPRFPYKMNARRGETGEERVIKRQRESRRGHLGGSRWGGEQVSPVVRVP